MRKNIVAGNWKMNTDLKAGRELIDGITKHLKEHKHPSHHQVIFSPPLVYVSTLAALASDSTLELAGQNCHQNSSGAYTGENAPQMLIDAGCSHVILGHSERREYFAETDELLKEKVDSALEAGLKVIFCCGEQLSTREAEKHFSFVSNQIEAALYHLTAEQMKDIIIAYEPIWAIGTGVTASAAQAEEMHAHIRKGIAEQFSIDLSEETTILYGGSVKPANARELFSQDNVDGGLVGGASLKLDSFIDIIDAL